MQGKVISTFADLVDKGPAIIRNLLKPKHVVRELWREDDLCRIVAGGETIDVPVDTEITYEPWDMDRGSLTFVHPTMGKLKICTEADILEVLDTKEQFSITPA